MSQHQAETTGSEIELPNPPEVVQELRSVSADASALTSIIVKDTDLAQEVLETINAPYFNLVREISSIDEAVRFLGKYRIIKLTTARSLRTTLFTENNSFLDNVWNASNQTAIVAVLLAKELKISCVEDAYEMGLFHNIGMAILPNHTEKYRSIIRAAYKHESGAISAFEQHHLQQDHATIGADLALKWHVPEKLVLVIKHHHNAKWIEQQFAQSNDKELLELICILKLAELFSNLSSYFAQTPTNHEWPKISEVIMNYLDLNELKLEKLKTTITEELAAMNI